jgi:hypothetical protein
MEGVHRQNCEPFNQALMEMWIQYLSDDDLQDEEMQIAQDKKLKPGYYFMNDEMGDPEGDTPMQFCPWCKLNL